jgi:hypothetical protein
MIGPAFAQETGTAPPGLGGSLGSWALAHIGTIGVALLGLMVMLVLWRALTRRPVGVGEALVGILGMIAIVLPLFAQLGSGAARADAGIAGARDDFAANIADLKTRLVALEETAKALQRQIAAVATAVSRRQPSGERGIQAEESPLTETLIYYAPPAKGRDAAG